MSLAIYIQVNKKPCFYSGERSSGDVQKRSNLCSGVRVNQKEEAYHTPFWLHIAHGHVEFIIHLYIKGRIGIVGYSGAGNFHSTLVTDSLSLL
ncbi:hypothetical protein [Ectobacillus panaciterrae]|uniref:hypothetical protein n=1 Tax=Ectobacillus panaciterrae TaxID=363872 RepID=UPI00048E15CA|nr:hypothetical protein [Ectobacillus panaciterrae]